MRHRGDPEEYNWSKIVISNRSWDDETGKSEFVTLVEGLGHVASLDNHNEYGGGLQIFVWDGTTSRDEDGDLIGVYLTIRGVNNAHFWREQAYWNGWLEASRFSEYSLKVLKDANLPIVPWTHVRVEAYWHKPEAEDNSGS